MKREINCPYCNVEVKNLQYNEDGWWAHICPHCNKRFFISKNGIATEPSSSQA